MLFCSHLERGDWFLSEESGLTLSNWLFILLFFSLIFAAFEFGHFTAHSIIRRLNSESIPSAAQDELEAALSRIVLNLIDALQKESNTKEEEEHVNEGEKNDEDDDKDDIPAVLMLHVLLNGNTDTTPSQHPPPTPNANHATTATADTPPHPAPSSPPTARTIFPLNDDIHIFRDKSSPSLTSNHSNHSAISSPTTLSLPSPPSNALLPTLESIRASARNFILEYREAADAWMARLAAAPRATHVTVGPPVLMPQFAVPPPPVGRGRLRLAPRGPVKMDLPLRRREQRFWARNWW